MRSSAVLYKEVPLYLCSTDRRRRKEMDIKAGVRARIIKSAFGL